MPAGSAGKYGAAAQFVCPDVIVSLNTNAVNVELDVDCSFLIDDVRPAASVVLFIELPALGVSGTIELTNVREAELIEVLVEAGDEISVFAGRVEAAGNNATFINSCHRQ